MNSRKRAVTTIIIIILVLATIFTINKFYPTGKNISQNVEIVPLSSTQRNQVIQSVLGSDFIQDIPGKEIIAINFFSFANGQKIWHDGFLLEQGGFATRGEPSIYLSLHVKYISELNSANICEIIGRANQNRDLGFYSEFGKARLLLKFASMLKYRQCFGV